LNPFGAQIAQDQATKEGLANASVIGCDKSQLSGRPLSLGLS